MTCSTRRLNRQEKETMMRSHAVHPARRRRPTVATTLLALYLPALYALLLPAVAVASSPTPAPLVGRCLSADLRGGAAAAAAARRKKKDGSNKSLKGDPYALLASAILDRISATADPSSSSGGDGGPTTGRAATTPHTRADPSEVRSALRSLSSAQSALKGIDGASHELYQRTHRQASESLAPDGGGVRGRAARSAARVGCVADALFAAELCELAEEERQLSVPSGEKGEEEQDEEDAVAGTLDQHGREVWLNVTVGPDDGNDQRDLTLTVLVLYEPDYTGGAGLNHGGIDGVLGEGAPPPSSSSRSPSSPPPRGRLLVIIRDKFGNDLPGTVSALDVDPTAVPLRAGLVANEVASVGGPLWRAAGSVLEAVRPALERAGNGTTAADEASAPDAAAKEGEKGEEEEEGRSRGTERRSRPSEPPAVHFVGRSLAGGVAALAAAVLDGSLPMPGEEDGASRRGKRRRGRGHRKKKKSGIKKRSGGDDAEGSGTDHVPGTDEAPKDGSEEAEEEKEEPQPRPSLFGYGRGRSSAVALGAPPCLSANVKAAFVTSVIHGDDVVCRTTRESLDRLCRRTKRAMKGGILGAKVGWMSNAVSLTVSGLKSHAHGSEGEEARLSVPGKAYLIRPRRYGGTSSMHEVGAVSGREALRAAVLWQLNDVLLSRSLWAHHSLDAYIKGLDHVQLRGFADDKVQNEDDFY